MARGFCQAGRGKTSWRFSCAVLLTLKRLLFYMTFDTNACTSSGRTSMVQHGMLTVTDPHAAPPSHVSIDELTIVSRHQMKQGHNTGIAGTSSRVTMLSTKSCTYALRRT